jgi:membrane associated rhomboid family serine protease
MPTPSPRANKFPAVTVAVFAITAVCTAFAYKFPQFQAALERTPAITHEWSRFITPVFINPEGALQIVLNFAGIALLGALIERRFSALRWLMIYFGSAFAGELAGHAWKPIGGGSSVGVAGLLGAVAALIAYSRAPQARIGAAVIVFGAITLTYFRDLHGPPILIGCALALLFLRIDNPPKPRKVMSKIV